jgi:hypothetical protein
MSKQEIVDELQSWVADASFAPNRDRIDQYQAGFNALKEETTKAQMASFMQEQEEAKEETFEYKNEAEDVRFEELLSIYHEKRKSIDKQRREQEAANLSEKKALISELQSLIQDEENIGKAYKRFNAIKQKWNEMGPVPNAERRDLQAEYSRLIELFYYNINIYRELQINDLKKNQEVKEEIIAKIALLEQEKSINQVDFLIHQYLDEWDQIGPTFQEEWEKIRDAFKEAVSKVFDRIREHRKEVKDEHEGHFKQKKELVEKAEEISLRDLTDVKEVQAWTKEIIDLQKQWKKTGYAGRGKNDKVWNEFRKACDAYFEKRDGFLKASNVEFEKAKVKKQSLIEKAKEIYEGDDRVAIANQLKGLQREWKTAGKLLPQEEYKLFKEFRKYCDDFFNRKKKEEEAFIKGAKENLKAKEDLLQKFSEALKANIKEKGEAVISEWRNEWSAVGNVEHKVKAKIDKAFEDVIGKAYESLGISKQDLAKKRFESKLEMLATDDNAEEALVSERNRIGQKIREVQPNLAQEEGKLDFFKFSNDSNPLKAEVLKRIEAVNKEIADLKSRKKQIDLTIKGMKKEAEKSDDASTEENTEA